MKRGRKGTCVRVRLWLDVCLYVWLLHPKHLIMRLVCAHIGAGHQIC